MSILQTIETGLRSELFKGFAITREEKSFYHCLVR